MNQTQAPQDVSASQSKNSENSVQIKRQLTIKTKVTDEFRQRASGGLTQEIQMIDTQMNQLESQYQSTLQELEKLNQQGQNVKQQLSQLNQEAQEKRNQLSNLKFEISRQISSLEKVENGNYVVTGVVESFVTLSVGDKIYEKLQNNELIVENGVVTEIRRQ